MLRTRVLVRGDGWAKLPRPGGGSEVGPSPVPSPCRAGEVLYLPSLWFHRVAQKADEAGRVIAVNYW